jgi:hypothetical protein
MAAAALDVKTMQPRSFFCTCQHMLHLSTHAISQIQCHRGCLLLHCPCDSRLTFDQLGQEYGTQQAGMQDSCMGGTMHLSQRGAQECAYHLGQEVVRYGHPTDRVAL